MDRNLRRSGLAGGMMALGLVLGTGATTARGQQVVAGPYATPAYSTTGVRYYRPGVVMGRGDARAVLPSFAPRGGIGTTPFLGNTRGVGNYSVNYDTHGRRAYRTRLFGRRWSRRAW